MQQKKTTGHSFNLTFDKNSNKGKLLEGIRRNFEILSGLKTAQAPKREAWLQSNICEYLYLRKNITRTIKKHYFGIGRVPLERVFLGWCPVKFFEAFSWKSITERVKNQIYT